MKNNEQIAFDFWYAKVSKNGTLMYAGRLLQYAATAYGDRTALIYNEQTMSYKELYIRACLLSDIMRQKGVRAHDKVIIFCDNSFAFYIAYYAAWQAGAVVVPLNTFLKETEITHILNDCQPALIVVDTDYKERFENSQFVLPPLIISGDINVEQQVGQVMPIDDIIEMVNADDIAVLLYTSGTTGTPKGVMLSSKNILTNVCQSMARLSITSHEKLLGLLPFFHSFSQVACLWISILVGATVIIVRKIERATIMYNLKTHSPSLIMGIPALYGFFCLLKNAPLSSVKYFVSGGDALPDKIRMLFALIYGRKICNGYGLTEASPVIAAELEDVNEATNTVGLPVIGVACSIRDAQNNALPTGVMGQVWVKGDNVMLGYYNNPTETARAIVDGWLDTGDCGYVQKNGKLVITGREKDLIINKGFNIYPQEVENVIISHPDVLRAGVIGQEDAQGGEVPIAFVQLRTYKKNIEKDLRTLCLQHLASYKVPRHFICSTQELPLTSTGKVDKKVLRTIKV